MTKLSCYTLWTPELHHEGLSLFTLFSEIHFYNEFTVITDTFRALHSLKTSSTPTLPDDRHILQPLQVNQPLISKAKTKCKCPHVEKTETQLPYITNVTDPFRESENTRLDVF